MHDMAAGRYKLPWSEQVQVTDGTPCGFAPPERAYGGNA
jgi:formamidase